MKTENEFLVMGIVMLVIRSCKTSLLHDSLLFWMRHDVNVGACQICGERHE